MSEPLSPLASTFHFTTSDLKHNRQWRISPAQGRRLWAQFWLTLFGGIGLVIMPLLLTWGVIAWATDQSISRTLTDERALIGYLMAGALGVLYLVFNGRTLLLAVDLLNGKVQSVLAPAQVWGRYLVLDDYRFVVDEAALAFIKTGIAYRAFVLPRSQTLLSIEFSD